MPDLPAAVYRPETKGAGLWRSMEAEHRPFLERARESSALTIQFLFPPEGTSGYTYLDPPYQSVGARGVNTLASKLLLALFPVSAPFFVYQLDESAALDRLRQQLEESGADDEAVRTQLAERRQALEQELLGYERAVHDDVESLGLRTHLFEGLRDLIAGGTTLIHVPEDRDGVRVVNLEHFRMRRDAFGKPALIVVRDTVPGHPDDPATDQRLPAMAAAGRVALSDFLDPAGTTEVFTVVRRQKDGTWVEEQQIKTGDVIPGTRRTYAANALPWVAPYFHLRSGENYGRGYVEQNMGDLASLEGHAQALVEGGAQLARFLWFVNPNSAFGTSARDVETAPNGAARTGNANDVTVLSAGEKAGDLRVVAENAVRLASSLDQAFLSSRSVQRNAERVTAAEIGLLAQELEEALGGSYAVLSQSLQLPLVQLLTARLARRGGIPQEFVRDQLVHPRVVTGIEAVGRRQDAFRLERAGQILQPLLGPEGLAALWRRSNVADLVLTSLGLEADELTVGEEGEQAASQSQLVQQLTEQLGPAIIKAITPAIQQILGGQQAPQQPTQ